MISPNQSIRPHYILNHQIQINPAPVLCTLSSPSSASSSSLSSSVRSCAGPGANSQPCPRCGASGTGGALHMPSRLSASGGRRTNYLFFIVFHFAAWASATLVVAVGDMLCSTTSSSRSWSSPHHDSCRRATGLFATWSYTDVLPLP